ncbi:putative ABC transporter permease [Cytobacillus sp. Hz8]|uniref:putative ABC transporter permease n=1 Tax=Cytobacillus sp. Hz8 TaxID=3347168 RepID=UPI0035E3116D
MKLSWVEDAASQPLDVLTMEGVAAIVFCFTVYSFLGWLLENSYHYFTNRKFFKENFLVGPFKPMYGFAPVILVCLISPETSSGTILLLCLFVPSIVEYISGALLLKLFHRQWWDYSNTPFQLHGHICLPYSICWVFLSLFCLKWLQPILMELYQPIELIWAWTWPAVGVYFLTELILAIRKHLMQDRIQLVGND